MPRLRTAPMERTPLLDAIPVNRPATFGRTVLAYIALTKPRIIELLLVTTIPTMFVAKRGVPGIWLIASTLIGGILAAGGANAINMYIDRDIDALMDRTKGRPLVVGAMSPRAALTFAVTIEILAFAWLTWQVNLLSAVLAVSACLFYVFIYSLWLKRTSEKNIVIGGAAGAVPVLVGWSAVTNDLSWAPILLFFVIFVWTPPHTWALAVKYTEDYRAAGVPMLPVVASFEKMANQIIVYTIVMWLATLVFVPVADMGLIYGVAALVLGAIFLGYALRLRKIGMAGEPTIKPAMRLFGWSITYVTLLFGVMILDQLV
jgi:heme o synthase